MSSSAASAGEGVSRPRPARGLARAAPAWIAALILAGVAGICWAALTRDTSVRVERRGELYYPSADGYVGDASCGSCHASIVESHRASAHASKVRTIRPGTPLGPYLTGQEVRDPLTGAIYQVRYRDNRNELFLRAGPLSATAEIVWEFGSGRRARGYILRTDYGEYVDCRLNWYHSTQGWDFASGQDKLNRILVEQPLGRPLPDGELARCFGCHSSEMWATGAKPEGTPADKLKFRFEKTKTGLSCETCHGPRAAHVRAFELGKPVTPAPDMTAAEMNELCARCHSKPDVDPENDVLARFQPWGLERSRCYTESKGRLSCATCHDPHANAGTDHASYESKCKSCHSSAGRQEKLALRLCPVNQTTGCVSCHMPRDDKGMLNVTLTDHLIRIVRDNAAAAAGARGAAPAAPKGHGEQ
jgi:hypothetical protein